MKDTIYRLYKNSKNEAILISAIAKGWITTEDAAKMRALEW